MEIKTWTKEEIKENLQVHPNWVVKALIALYDKQTEDEKNSEQTKHTNGVGFSSYDAEILSSFAKQVKRWQAGTTSYNEPLSYKQMALARKRVLKYAGQLAKIANGEL